MYDKRPAPPACEKSFDTMVLACRCDSCCRIVRILSAAALFISLAPLCILAWRCYDARTAELEHDVALLHERIHQHAQRLANLTQSDVMLHADVALLHSMVPSIAPAPPLARRQRRESRAVPPHVAAKKAAKQKKRAAKQSRKRARASFTAQEEQGGAEAANGNLAADRPQEPSETKPPQQHARRGRRGARGGARAARARATPEEATNWTRLSKLMCSVGAGAVHVGEAKIPLSDDVALVRECVSRCEALAKMAALFSTAVKDMIGTRSTLARRPDAQMRTCDAVTVVRPGRHRRAQSGQGGGAQLLEANCFYRTQVVPSDCKRDSAFDTYTSPHIYEDWRWRLPRFDKKAVK